MTELSPAAQAILDAYGDFESANVDAMAAALRAAADHLKQQKGWSLGVRWSADELLAIAEDFAENRAGVGVLHDGAWGHRHHHRLTGAATFIGTHSVLAAFTRPLVAVGVIEEGCKVRIAADGDVPTATAIAAVGAAHGLAPLATERGATGTASAGFNMDFYKIDEHGCVGEGDY